MEDIKLSIHPINQAKINGLNYHFIEKGSGEAIVFLHGFPDLAHTWDYSISQLSDKYKCIAPNMRGYYPTDMATDNDYSGKKIAEDILKLTEHLGINSFYLVGQDWGASIAYALANLAPDKVTKLITVAIPHPRFIKPSLKLLIKARHFFVFRNKKRSVKKMQKNDFKLVDTLYQRWSPNMKDYKKHSEVVKQTFALPGRTEAALAYYWSFFDNANDKELGKFYAQLPKMPTLAIAGKTDGALILDQFYDMEKGMPEDFRLRISETAGHFLHNEVPDYFITELLDFIKK